MRGYISDLLHGRISKAPPPLRLWRIGPSLWGRGEGQSVVGAGLCPKTENAPSATGGVLMVMQRVGRLIKPSRLPVRQRRNRFLTHRCK